MLCLAAAESGIMISETVTCVVNCMLLSLAQYNKEDQPHALYTVIISVSQPVDSNISYKNCSELHSLFLVPETTKMLILLLYIW
jgi:hypothetical protein